MVNYRLMGLAINYRHRIGIRNIGIAVGLLLSFGLNAYGASPEGFAYSDHPPTKTFYYTAKKLGIPLLKAILCIGNGSVNGKNGLYRVDAQVVSHQLPGFMFRMNNRFTSMIEKDPFGPIQYIKRIDQEGFFIKKKKYIQTITFDSKSPKAIVEKDGDGEKIEIVFPSVAFDPLALLVRYHLKESLPVGQEIPMSIFDGVKFRQMIFQANPVKVTTPFWGTLEAICLESKTAFSSFGEKEGTIRIWYVERRDRIPISLELDLPAGVVKFELEDIREGSS